MLSKQVVDAIKVGDRAWLGRDEQHKRLDTVTHRTATQICFGKKGNDGRYFHTFRLGARQDAAYGTTYYASSGTGMWPDYVLGIATVEECADWDAQQERKRLEEVARQQKITAEEAKGAELTNLFPGEHTHCSKDEWTDSRVRDHWEVTFRNLTEQQVRQLAALVARD